MVSSTTKYLLFLVWAAGVYLAAIYIFTSGFLLQRKVLPQQADCVSRPCNQPPQLINKAVIILIDALKYDFCVFNESLEGRARPYQNKLPVFAKYAKPDPQSGVAHGKLFRFVADPPTTTMQRLKGLTTGSLPTFIDVSANFASYEIQEDNIFQQLANHGKRIHFAGDDTWESLYPKRFKKSLPLPSFDVWDLDTVDTQVTKFLNAEMRQSKDWDVLVTHFLGVDHAGHKYGPHHPEMGRKLVEMNAVIEATIKILPRDAVLMVFGDHGMTSSGDHGGDSDQEVQAGLFVYGLKLGLNPEEESSVAQIDLVPTLSLLMGVPVPFSNLGTIIDELFIPTMVVQDSYENHAKKARLAYEDLVKFRMSYMKANVEQVYRYLTAYLAAGGTFPHHLNSKIRDLAAQVINRPGVLSPRQTVELYNKCRTFLNQANTMCRSAWVHFNLQAISCSLTVVVLHTSVLCLLVLRPHSRLLSTLVSGFLLFSLGVGILVGSLLGATVAIFTGMELALVMLSSGGLVTVLSSGIALLWSLRFSLWEILREVWGNVESSLVVSLCLLVVTSLSAFSNSFVVLEARCLNFAVVSLFAAFVFLDRCSRSGMLMGMVVLVGVGLARLSTIYIRCREEEGPDCTLTDFHKPLATLPAEEGAVYKNWRYFFTLLTLFALCLPLHTLLSYAGNLNGLGCSVLAAKYLPSIISTLMAGHWALQAFPSTLVMRLLPWQQDLLAQLVLALSAAGTVILILNPRLVYFQSRKRTLNKVVARTDNVATYFNFMKANWKSALMDRSTASVPMAYGLGTCISAPLICLGCMVTLFSMLLAGDGQCPAVLLVVAQLSLALVVTSPLRLARAKTASTLVQVPLPSLILWLLIDQLSFFTTGHQATFPHIQWSAAFVGVEGAQLGGETFAGHILPAILIGWNTYSGAVISGVLLPLLVVAPFTTWILIPSLRPLQPLHQLNGSVGSLYNSCGSSVYEELERGEAVLLDRAEEARGAAFILAIQYIILKGVRLTCSMMAAAMLRRHLMVWKIFAPKFIFEGIGFMVSLVSVLLGYLLFTRVLSSLSAWYSKLTKS